MEEIQKLNGGQIRDAQQRLKQDVESLMANEKVIAARDEKKPIEENLCGQPHNNGEEDCVECEIIRRNL